MYAQQNRFQKDYSEDNTVRMSLGRAGALVSTTWLKKQLSSAPRTLKVLDSSSTRLKSGREDFLSKHIPGAQFFDLNACVTPTALIPRNLPDPACLQEYIRSLGINKDDDVILYDRGTIVAACRAWWTFRAFGHDRVAVMDGGIKKWEAEGLELETGEANKPEAGNFEVSVKRHLISTFEDLIKYSREESAQIVDARLPDNFYGKVDEPSFATKEGMIGMGMPQPSSLKRGHIKGSINLTDEPLFDPDKVDQYKVFKDETQLVKVFQDLGIDLNRPLVATCYLGNFACTLAMAAYLCGKTDVPNYYGSWTEFGQRAEDRDITQGSPPEQ